MLSASRAVAFRYQDSPSAMLLVTALAARLRAASACSCRAFVLFFFSILIDLVPNPLRNTGIALLGFFDRAPKRRIASCFSKRLDELFDLCRGEIRRFGSNSACDLFNGCCAQNIRWKEDSLYPFEKE